MLNSSSIQTQTINRRPLRGVHDSATAYLLRLESDDDESEAVSDDHYSTPRSLANHSPATH